MIVPPQAVMLTAHVGDSLRCLIAKSRQAGVTRPALHKGPGDGAFGNCFWRSPPTPPTTTTTTIKGACFASKTITTISQRRRLAPRQRSRAAAHDNDNSRTFFSISIVLIDLLTVGGRCWWLHVVTAHSKRTHARTHEPRIREKNDKKLLTHCRERNAKNHEETPKNSRSRAHAPIFCYTDRFCSFYLVGVRVDHLRKSH